MGDESISSITALEYGVESGFILVIRGYGKLDFSLIFITRHFHRDHTSWAKPNKDGMIIIRLYGPSRDTQAMVPCMCQTHMIEECTEQDKLWERLLGKYQINNTSVAYPHFSL